MKPNVSEMRSKWGLNKFIMKNQVIFILIFLCVLASISSPYFLTSQNLINVLRQVTTAGIIGIGFTIVLTSGQIDLSVGSMLGLIGTLTAIISKIDGLPFVFVIPIAILIGALLGGFNGMIINVLKVPAFIATLATMSIFRGPVYIISNMNPITGIPSAFTKLGQGYVGPIPIPIIILFVATVAGYIFLNKTTLGRHVTAMGGNPGAARACGINLKKTTYLVFIFMGIFTAVAALVMTGRSNSAQTGAGVGMELDAIAAVVIGGTSLMGGSGNIPGTIFGCLIVGVINNFLNLANINSNYQMIVKGVLIVTAIFLDVQSVRLRERLSKIQLKT